VARGQSQGVWRQWKRPESCKVVVEAGDGCNLEMNILPGLEGGGGQKRQGGTGPGIPYWRSVS